MTHIKEFEKELQKLDNRFSVRENPNRIGLYNIFFNGANYDLPPLPEEVKDAPDEGYRYEFPNGISARFWSKEDVMPRLKDFLVKFNNGEFEDLYE